MAVCVCVCSGVSVGPWLCVCVQVYVWGHGCVCVSMCRCVWGPGSMWVTVCVLRACEVSVRFLVCWKHQPSSPPCAETVWCAEQSAQRGWVAPGVKLLPHGSDL